MSTRWLSLFSVALLVVWLLRDAITEMCQEEIKTRLSLLPYALLRVVALRVPRDMRQEVAEEWRAELDYILRDTDGMPLTRLVRGIHYSVSLLRLLLPVSAIADLIARYATRHHRGLHHSGAEKVMASRTAVWTSSYLRQVITADGLCALASGLLALKLRFDGGGNPPSRYLALSLGLPLIWLCIVALTGGYDSRFIGVGTDEFRRVLNAGLTLTATVAIAAYATKTGIARGYVVIALPCLTLSDLIARFTLRKRLHRLRTMGRCARRVVAVGSAMVVADLVRELRRETYHGLSVVAACVAGPEGDFEVNGIPFVGGLRNVASVVERYDADTVAVLACPEMDGVRLRELAWELEKTGTDLCVAPALLDVAGPRTTIRPVAGLPLLHVDHPELTGAKQVIKNAFDKVLGVSALVLLAPVFVVVALAIRLSDGGPALFRQTRVGKDGSAFTVYTFRTTALATEDRNAQLAVSNEKDGVLFKIRNDPRITPVGAWLRRWSLDELPQLINVVRGDMSLIGPRPALPDEAAMYGDYVRRRLAVKPGITGLWQVNGRSDLSWEESVRLDLRYVENWSLVLDLQILWKTISSIWRGSGTYFPPSATEPESS